MKHLQIQVLGKLLRIAQRGEIERKKDLRSMIEQAQDAYRDTLEKLNGNFERSSPQRDLFLALSALNREERLDVVGLYYLGRRDGDDFDVLRCAGPSAEQMPTHLSEKANFGECVIEGIRRLGNHGSSKITGGTSQ